MPPICVGQGPGVNQLIIICPLGPILHSSMSANDCDNWCLHFKECCLFLRLEIGLCCTSCVKTATHTSSGSSQYSVLNIKLIRTITLQGIHPGARHRDQEPAKEIQIHCNSLPPAPEPDDSTSLAAQYGNNNNDSCEQQQQRGGDRLGGQARLLVKSRRCCCRVKIPNKHQSFVSLLLVLIFHLCHAVCNDFLKGCSSFLAKVLQQGQKNDPHPCKWPRKKIMPTLLVLLIVFDLNSGPPLITRHLMFAIHQLFRKSAKFPPFNGTSSVTLKE